MSNANVSGGWFWGRYSGLGLAVALTTGVIDQANKLWMMHVFNIEEKGRVAVLPFLDLVFVKNTGISYGLFRLDTPAGQWTLAGIAVAATLAFWVWLARARDASQIMAISLGLIMGGAIGNAIDRVTIGGVADFYDLHVAGWHWYVFNIADAAIVAGVAGLLYELVVSSRKEAVNP